MPNPGVKSVQRSWLKTQCHQMYFQSKTGGLPWTFGTYQWLSPDPHKVQAISNMPVLSNKTELQPYIGMCSFLSSYVPQLTDKLFVLQQLMAKDSVLSGQ